MPYATETRNEYEENTFGLSTPIAPIGNNLLNLPIRGAILFHDFVAGQSNSKSQSALPVLHSPKMVLERAKVSLRIGSIFSIWDLPLLAGVGSISVDMSCRIQPRNAKGANLLACWMSQK